MKFSHHVLPWGGNLRLQSPFSCKTDCANDDDVLHGGILRISRSRTPV